MQAPQAGHRTTLAIRGQEKGVTLNVPRREACDPMLARGFVK